MQTKKVAWLAALLNFILPGAGYVYVGQRLKFGVLLLAGMVLVTFGPRPEYASQTTIDPSTLATDPGVLVMGVAALLIALGFAYDGYCDAKTYNQQPKAPVDAE